MRPGGENRRQAGDLAISVGPELRLIERRLFLRQTLSLGALTLLTGCDATAPSGVQSILKDMSKFNDGVQAAIFRQNRLAPTSASRTSPNPSRSTHTIQRPRRQSSISRATSSSSRA